MFLAYLYKLLPTTYMMQVYRIPYSVVEIAYTNAQSCFISMLFEHQNTNNVYDALPLSLIFFNLSTVYTHFKIHRKIKEHNFDVKKSFLYSIHVDE